MSPESAIKAKLHLAAEELNGSEMTPQLRVQLGLLAAQVAVADRLSALLSGTDTVESDPVDTPPDIGEVEGVEWTPAVAAQILRSSTPGGYRLVQALIAEGGSAPVGRLSELTGDSLLRAATQSLNVAARREGVTRGLPERRLIQAIRYPNPLTSKVAAYSLPTESIPAFTAAIELLDDLHRRLHE
ncbi:hypothetical protein AB0M45_05220 [Nocardia sp. NPDC051787]|uniref:hypothetical protein n=1 Tax=Nocardia sp. NPDC051787 TaxID=3155415 RepID=UPI00342CB459